jgi:hypothetical protein
MRRDQITPSDGEGRLDETVYRFDAQTRLSDSAQALHTKDAPEVIHVKVIERASIVIC